MFKILTLEEKLKKLTNELEDLNKLLLSYKSQGKEQSQAKEQIEKAREKLIQQVIELEEKLSNKEPILSVRKKSGS